MLLTTQRAPLRVAAVVGAFLAACNSPEREASREQAVPRATTFTGSWKFASEDIDMSCRGPELERGPDPHRRVEFTKGPDHLALKLETCHVPLEVSGSVASALGRTECPWVDGMTVRLTSARAELESSGNLHLVTRLEILGEHPATPGQVFDCTATSDAMLTKMRESTDSR